MCWPEVRSGHAPGRHPYRRAATRRRRRRAPATQRPVWLGAHRMSVRGAHRIRTSGSEPGAQRGQWALESKQGDHEQRGLAAQDGRAERGCCKDVPVPTHRHDPGHDEGGRHDLGQIAGQHPDESEVARQQQAPARVAPRVPGHHRPERPQARQSDEIHQEQRPRDDLSLPCAHQPGQRRIADALEPTERVHPDPKCGSAEVQRSQGHPVVELAVVALAGPDRDTGGDPTPNVRAPDDDEGRDVAVTHDQDPRPRHEAGGNAGDAARPTGAVHPMRQRGQACEAQPLGQWRPLGQWTGPARRRRANGLTTSRIPVDLLG